MKQDDFFPNLLEQASREEREQKIRNILENPIWISTIDAHTRYARQHDDTDGKNTGWLAVCFGDDADAWVDVDFGDGLRFRTFNGGGNSHRTRMALHILAEAIRLDNIEYPQRRKPLICNGPLAEKIVDAITNSKMDPKHDHLNSLL